MLEADKKDNIGLRLVPGHFSHQKRHMKHEDMDVLSLQFGASQMTSSLALWPMLLM